jgi:hypothetical protein
MTLANIIENLSDFDDNLTIYAERNPKWSAASPAVVSLENENGEVIDAPPNLSYLLEVDIANEVLEVWINWHKREPSTEEKCSAIIYYAENDAYIE